MISLAEPFYRDTEIVTRRAAVLYLRRSHLALSRSEKALKFIFCSNHEHACKSVF
jgi:hypothetical protein